jgi:hypothetical protein
LEPVWSEIVNPDAPQTGMPPFSVLACCQLPLPLPLPLPLLLLLLLASTS